MTSTSAQGPSSVPPPDGEPATTSSAPCVLVRDLASLGMGDVAVVGGKNASLGEMLSELESAGVRVPGGFATTAQAYRLLVEQSRLGATIEEQLDGLDTNDVRDLQTRGRAIREAFLAAPWPEELERSLTEAYQRLSAEVVGGASVAVRSSATAEDLPDASFAGQLETLLNVRGEASLLDACRRCFASLFTDRAISYRVDKGFDHHDLALSIGVQLMVRSDLAASGVMFSLDTETGFRDVVLIDGAYGLGENVVQGTVTPDEFYVFKPTLLEGKRPILERRLGSKELKLVCDSGGSKKTRNVPVPLEARTRFCIGDDDVLTLARWACAIERHYSEKRGRPVPMDMEWAKDGRTGELFIVQARPETVHSRRPVDVLERYELEERGTVLITGHSVGDRIGVGRVRLISRPEDMHLLEPGEVLVSEKTDPDWEPIMKRASAVVTDRGGRTCHAAIVSRELGLPAIVGCGSATELLKTGTAVTVSCAEGDRGSVYAGELGFRVEQIPLGELKRPKTEIMLNIANPTEAFRHSFLPNDGVGLAREEFIISNFIKAHPLALLEPESLDQDTQRQIAALVSGYGDAASFFVDKLAEGVSMIAAAFYPKPVIVRLSDFKTNEYAHLLGGGPFEPAEDNPMLGFRGASRYYDEHYLRGFELECRALRKVREEMGLVNVKIMVPFCRTVEEGRRVQEEMAKQGLVRGRDGLELYIMCELPSNVVLADRFAEIYDGFSIGSNDLTQLTLGVDRDSEIVAHLFDERDDAVKTMIAMAIRAAKKSGRKIGLCGQAPSDYPEFARFLVEQGIDSMSLNPDAVLSTTVQVLAAEAELEPDG